MFGIPTNPGQFYGPSNMLYSYKNMEVSVAGGIAVVSVNKYRNFNYGAEAKGGCDHCWPMRETLRQVAPDAWDRAGGSVAYANVFCGKGSPWAIAGVLETFAAYSDKYIKAYGKRSGSWEKKCADLLADDALSWEQTLQKICDLLFGIDCNAFVGHWLSIVEPAFKFNYNSRSNDIRPKAKAIRSKVEEFEFWDVMCYVKNEHIAAINAVAGSPGHCMICQSAGGGPRMNDFSFIRTGPQTFKLAAPTPQDIGNDFYVISLW